MWTVKADEQLPQHDAFNIVGPDGSYLGTEGEAPGYGVVFARMVLHTGRSGKDRSGVDQRK